MRNPLIEGRDLAFKNVLEALLSVDVAPEEKRAALEALLATPWPRGPVKEVGPRNLSVGTPASRARPYPRPVSRQLRQTILELRHADLTFLGGGDSLRRTFCSGEAHGFAGASPAAEASTFQSKGTH